GDRHHRHNDGSQRAEEQKDHQHHDEQRVDQRLYDFVDGVADVSGRVVSNLSRQTRGQFALDLLHFRAHTLYHVNRIRIRQNVDAHEHGLLPGEPDFRVVVFRTQNDVRDVSQPNESSFVLTHHKFFEIIRSVQVGVRSEIYLKQ